MTTKDIENLADPGNLSRTDLEVRAILRRLVIPKFLLDVEAISGKVSWRRQKLELPVTTAARDYDLPADYDWVESIQPYDSANTQYSSLKYIGEDAYQVSIADSATTSYPGRPTGYYIIAGSSNPYAIRLNTYPDQSYTMRGVYYWRIPFDDTDAVVDLDSYIPNQIQGALIHALRAHIYADRLGIKDNRTVNEKEEYNSWLASIKHRKEGAARNHARFVN